MRSLVSWVIPQRHSQEPKCLACVGFHVVLGVEAPDVFEGGESAVVPDRVLTKSGHHRVDAFHVALCVVGWLEYRQWLAEYQEQLAAAAGPPHINLVQGDTADDPIEL